MTEPASATGSSVNELPGRPEELRVQVPASDPVQPAGAPGQPVGRVADQREGPVLPGQPVLLSGFIWQILVQPSRPAARIDPMYPAIPTSGMFV